MDASAVEQPDSPKSLLTWPASAQRACLTPQQAADYLGISRAKVYRLLSEGQIRSLTIGRSRRIPLTELDRFIADHLDRLNGGWRFS